MARILFRFRTWRLLAGVAAAVSCSAHAVEIMRWERLPLAVPLQVGQERIIFVDQNVRVGIPSSISKDIRVQSASGAIYLLALKPIEPSRIQLQSATTGELILVDIAATAAVEGAPDLEPVKIVRGDIPADRYGSAGGVDGAAEHEVEPEEQAQRPAETPVPVVLTRYASQSLYAPLRTVEPVDGLTQANIRSDMDLSTLAPSLPVRAHALAAWRLGNHWVTAVKLTNISAHQISLDPRALQGDLLTATFQHPYLGHRGDPSDTTVVYLVTRGRDLAQSVLPSLSQVDSASNLGSANNGDQ
jgi:integrating conjugative element protein (TIGR03749 family)